MSTNEEKYNALRSAVSEQRVYAKMNVEYYTAKIASLSNKIRIFRFISAASSVVTAFLVPFVPKGGYYVAVPAMACALIVPLLMVLMHTMKWVETREKYRRAQDASRLLEIEFDSIYSRLDRKDFSKLSDVNWFYAIIERKWGAVDSAAPSEEQDDELATRCQRRVEQQLGLRRDDCRR